MRVVLQRVSHASCTVDGKITGKIDNGYMALVGFKKGEGKEVFEKMLKKIIGLRVFSDSEGKMNLDIKKTNGSILLISQFTLYADARHGNRPGFTDAMEFDKANEYYLDFVELLRSNGIKVETGIFGADMKIELLNDGPVTIILDSDNL